jgi:hypothetical protein
MYIVGLMMHHARLRRYCPLESIHSLQVGGTFPPT